MSRKNSTKWRQSGTSPRLIKIIRLLLAVVFIKLLVLAGLFFMPELSFGPGQSVALAPVQPTLKVAEAFAEEKAAQPEQPAQPAAAEPPSSQAESAKPEPLDREALAVRQEELNRKEQSLKTLEQNLDVKLAELKELEAKLERMLEDADGIKDKKLRHLVDVYSNMKAKQAAQVLESLDEGIAVKILAGMRGRQAGEILTYVKAEKAAVLSEALTRMQLPFE